MTQPTPDQFAIVVVAVRMEVLVNAADIPNINDETVGQLVPHGVVREARLERVIAILEGTAENVSYSDGSTRHPFGATA